MSSVGNALLYIGASVLWSTLAKVTIVAVIGLVAARLAHKAAASFRHALLASTLAVMALVPLASALLPGLSIAIATSESTATASTPSASTAAPSLSSSSNIATAPRATAPDLVRLPSARNVAIGAWTSGSALLVLSLAVSVWRLARVRRRGLPWIDATALTRQWAGDVGIRRTIDVVTDEQVSAPMTCGVFRPAIILPLDARGWDAAHLRRAIVHELEHVRRVDWWTHVAARAVCALYWFHPLVWMVSRELSLNAERACDDAVLEQEEATDYATQLVALARRMGSGEAQPALAMANRSDLAARVSAVSDTGQVRGRTGMARASLLAAGALAIVAALSPLRVTASVLGDDAGQARERRDRPSEETRFLAARLVDAAARGVESEVAALVDAGAGVNATVDGDGSPLIAAAREGHHAVVTALLARGADPNLAVRGDGNPLIMAAREGHADVVRALLDHGALIDESVEGDENALIQASAAGHLEVVTLLVSRGADVNRQVWSGRLASGDEGEWRSPLSMARRNRRTAVVEFLLSAGAERRPEALTIPR